METLDLHPQFHRQISFEDFSALNAEERRNVADYEVFLPRLDFDSLDDDNWGYVVLHLKQPEYSTNFER